MATLTATKNYVSYCDALKGIVADIDARVFFKNGEVNAANEGWCDGIIISATLTASGGYAVVFEYDTANVPSAFVITFDSATSEGNSCDPESLAECSLMKKIDAMQAAQELAVNPPVQWGEIEGILSLQTDLVDVVNAKAPKASPAFTGIPTAPTAAPSTDTTQVATTAFVQEAVLGLTPLSELVINVGDDTSTLDAAGITFDSLIYGPTKYAADGITFDGLPPWSPYSGIFMSPGTNLSVGAVISETGGNVTVNASAGRVRIGAGSTNVVITNNNCHPTSIVVASILNGNGSQVINRLDQSTNGQFTIYLNSAAATDVDVNWICVN